MAIIEEEDNQHIKQIIDIDALSSYISPYKFPLILAAIGIAFLLVGIIYIVKTKNSSSDVIFSSGDSSSSAKLAKETIHVDVEGAVMSPGVYEIEEGSRINSALSKAGGLSANADREWVAKNLNLAAKLVDGGKIYIPSATEVSSGQIQNSKFKIQNLNDLNNSNNLQGVTAGKININSASQPDIEGLPGIGSVTAMKIINGRPYQTVEELKSKKIVGNALYTKIKDLITL